MVGQCDSGNIAVQGRNWPLSDCTEKARRRETKQHFVSPGAAGKQACCEQQERGLEEFHTTVNV